MKTTDSPHSYTLALAPIKYKSVLVLKKSSLIFLFLMVLVGISVFVRLFLALPPFSRDYESYITIIKTLNKLKVNEILGSNLLFPYTVADGIVPVEVGFSVLVKIFSSTGLSPESVYALLASLSVTLRFFVMRVLKVPLFFIVLLNMIFLTLFEANALRLGIASSILLLAVYQLSLFRIGFGLCLIFISLLIHLQVAFFIVPFLLLFWSPTWLLATRFRVMLVGVGIIVTSIIASRFLFLIDNDKIQEYIFRGISNSAGVSLTSVLGIFLFLLVGISLRSKKLATGYGRFLAVILLSCIPSLVFFIILTGVAVVGDRSWQVAFLVISSFVFFGWMSSVERARLYVILFALTSVVFVNVIIRFPLSDFFAPLLPGMSSAI